MQRITTKWLSWCWCEFHQEEVPHSHSANSPEHVQCILAAAFVYYNMSDEGRLQGSEQASLLDQIVSVPWPCMVRVLCL